MNEDPPTIEHNPHEKRPGNGIWWFWAVALPLFWVWYLCFFDFDWPSLALGALTALILVSWSVDMTGNKVPDSWRR